jgi:hypothetical protein
LNKKRVVAFKLGALGNVFQGNQNGFMNFQLGRFLSFFRSGSLFIFIFLPAGFLLFQLAGFDVGPWRMLLKTGNFIRKFLNGLSLLLNNFQQQQNGRFLSFSGILETSMGSFVHHAHSTVRLRRPAFFTLIPELIELLLIPGFVIFVIRSG